MKLPEDRKERTKILIMIAVGVVAVIYAIFELAILPLLAEQNLNRKKMVDSQVRITKIKRDLLNVPRLRADFNSTTSHIATLSEHLAQPVLGTYLLGIQNTIDSLSANLDIRMVPAAEIGIAELPGSNKDGLPHSLRSYSVRTTFYGGYREIMAFFRALEASNPMMCITEFSISAQNNSPEKHQVNFTAQWPIWDETGKTSETTPSPVGAAPAPATASKDDKNKSSEELTE